MDNRVKFEIKLYTKTIVTSDSDEILHKSSVFEQVELIKRLANISNDKASSIEVVNHCLSKIKNNKYTHFILLQPTSPLRIT